MCLETYAKLIQGLNQKFSQWGGKYVKIKQIAKLEAIMYLTHHESGQQSRWALDGRYLPEQLNLSLLLGLPNTVMLQLLQNLPVEQPANNPLIAPIEAEHEVWAAGVTYQRSRDAREAESEVSDVYSKVYEAERPEIFFKSSGWRVAAPENPIRVRRDSSWNVPEPELVLVINRHLEIVGYCAGNDVSSRKIEGENPLYLPQAKIYNGSCALGPGIVLADPAEFSDLPIQLKISRQGQIVFEGETRTSRMKRRLDELAACLGQELEFPFGGFLMTGTGIVPPDDFNLQTGDIVQIKVDELVLNNPVES